MTITATQKASIEEILHIICTYTPPRSKRQLAGMFLDLVDREEWPQYYELIPEPRCLNNIRSSVEKNRYKDVLDAHTDISLVFWNALFYNEADSQIALDAQALKGILEAEWKKRPVLPAPRGTSPPASSPQKVHATVPAAAPAPTPAVPARTSTPLIQSQPPIQPAASTSTHTFTVKPVLSHPKSPPRQTSSEMDVDVGGMSPEPEGQGEDIGIGAGMERDVGSEEIVRQLEKGLPRWEGFGENGWMSETDSSRYLEIVHVIKGYKDVIGNRVAVALEAIPEESTLPNLSYTFPLSLKLIESRARAKSYASSKDFDMEMARLFEKARRSHEPGTDQYGRVLLLQRLYQALTSDTPPVGPPYSSTTNFASLRAGPGNAKPLHSTEADGVAGVTTFRVSAKYRRFVDEVHYKGWSVRLADWLHLSNPDNPSRPIIAQVFKCWVSEDIAKNGKPGLTVCWYYRPEQVCDQTFHPSHRQFWEGEAFKTSHFADHPLEDVIEKIACQFTARHIRGRPRPPFWYLGWPLYVCDSRYNDRDRVFVKIKNWNSCVPEEVRKSTEFMPIYPFERTVFPRRFGSPFLAKSGKSPVKGPGGIEEADKGEGDKDKPEAAGAGRKRSRRTAGTAAGEHAGPNKGVYVGVPGTQGNSNAAASSSSSHHQYQLSHLSQQTQPHHRSQASGDRSVINAAGGLATLGNNVVIEKLPPETAKHFDRDPDTNEVLWFAGPPTNVARAPAPKHSLAYLHFLATKRKKESSGDDDRMDVDDELSASGKRQKVQVLPTVTESLRSILADIGRPV